jgi:hypothetical protein
MATQLQPPPHYRLLGDLANRISGRTAFSVARDSATDWLRVTFERRSLLVSAEFNERDGWCYRWGNAKNRQASVQEVVAVERMIAALLMGAQT